jgi:hypothetical protein
MEEKLRKEVGNAESELAKLFGMIQLNPIMINFVNDIYIIDK